MYKKTEGVLICDMHEFGIIASLENDIDYVFYEPEKYDCISVDGDLLDELFSKDFGKNREFKDICT